MSQHESKSRNSREGDPRLLLPEWLRDEPEGAESDAGAHQSPADLPTGVVTSSTGDAANVDDDSPIRSTPIPPAVKAKWQSPPPPVESFDPGILIAPDDLPGWIRTMSTVSPPDAGGIPSVASVVTPGDAASLDSTLPDRTLDRSVGPESEQIAPPVASDLTETRVVLLVGGTLVIILAVIARFYL